MVVLGAVDHAGLQRGVELGPGDRHAGRAQRLHGVDHHRRGHDADLLALEIVGRAHRLLGEEVARAGIDVAEDLDALVLERLGELGGLRLRQEPPEMRLVLEQERQRIHVHRRHDLIEVRGRDGGEADGAVADALHVGDGVAELRVVIDLDLDRALGQEADFFAEIFLGVARRMLDRLDAGIFGDDLRACRRHGGEQRPTAKARGFTFFMAVSSRLLIGV